MLEQLKRADSRMMRASTCRRTDLRANATERSCPPNEALRPSFKRGRRDDVVLGVKVAEPMEGVLAFWQVPVRPTNELAVARG
jgi:hypothetical protein